MAKRKKKQQSKNMFQSLKDRLQKQSSILLFCLGLVTIMFIYYWFYSQEFFNENINRPILEFYAWTGSGSLNIFGLGTSVNETFVLNNEFSLNVGKGCDALSPMVLIMAAILTFPIAFKLKIPALIIAPIAIIFLNIIRIMSLFLIGVHAPDFFEIAHVEIWQSIFIIFCLMGWLYWLVWAVKKQKHAVA